jgi:hypothetical protein
VLTPAPSGRRFDAAALAGLDEPVRRYLTHALAEGGVMHERVELRMAGRIKVGPWLAFSATQRFAGAALEWSARAGWGRVRPLHVVDRYDAGAGSTDGRLFGRWRFLHVVIPSRVTIGWWYGTPRYAPFLDAAILDARPV